ncbi:MAG: chemotaxis protein CheW [Thermodesulfobacteriota bacterium]|nr:chemotaxis protein CheW [Thermodesulfobacteriota bacterium]
MIAVDGKKLIFRLGKTGLLLELDEVVEVVEQIAGRLDSSRSDIGRGIVSALQFRQTWIPAVDPALKLDIFSEIMLKDKKAVILRGSEGNWALLVDQVDDLSAAEDFQSCEIPFLLKVSAMGFYSQIKLLHNEPMIVFEPERYYGSTAVSV